MLNGVIISIMKSIILAALLIATSCTKNYAQITFSQTQEKGIKKNILFGQYQHHFRRDGTEKITEVSPSIGRVTAITDSSFNYYMSAPITSGKLQFIVKYILRGRQFTDTLEYEFVPKTRYSFKLVNHLGKKPSIDDLNKKKLQFIFFYDNQEISCELECLTIMYAPKRGESPPPWTCCKTTGIMDIYKCLCKFEISNGDRLYLERPVFIYNGQKITSELSFELKY